jgi:hypothetical protein
MLTSRFFRCVVSPRSLANEVRQPGIRSARPASQRIYIDAMPPPSESKLALTPTLRLNDKPAMTAATHRELEAALATARDRDAP